MLCRRRHHSARFAFAFGYGEVRWCLPSVADVCSVSDCCSVCLRRSNWRRPLLAYFVVCNYSWPLFLWCRLLASGVGLIWNCMFCEVWCDDRAMMVLIAYYTRGRRALLRWWTLRTLCTDACTLATLRGCIGLLMWLCANASASALSEVERIACCVLYFCLMV